MGFGYYLYFTERARNRVIRWDIDANEASVIAGSNPSKDHSQQLDDPYGLAVDSQGRLLIANKHKHRLDYLSNGRLKEWPLKDADGHRQRLPQSPKHYDPTLYCPTSLFVEPEGTLLCSFSDDFTIYRIFPDAHLELALGVTRNHGCRFGRFVAEANPEQSKQVALYGPTAVIKRSDGTIFFIERGYQSVRAFHPERGLRSLFPYHLQPAFQKTTKSPPSAIMDEIHPAIPSALALDAHDNLFLADVCMNALWQLDLQQRRMVRVATSSRDNTTYGGPTALVFGPDGTAWVADSALNCIQGYRVRHNEPWERLDTCLTAVAGDPIKIRPGGLGMVCSPLRIE